MKWEIKHGFRQDTLLNHANEKAVIIRRKRGSYLILDLFGQIIYQLKRETPLMIQYHGTHDGFAKIKLSEEKGFLIPPRADSAEVTVDGSTCVLCQSKNRDFVISNNDEEIGIITGILHRRSKIDISDVFSGDTVALFYALSQFMLHADDIDIV